MGKVDCFTIPGLRCWFNSNDHMPYHLHVSRSGEWEIRVFFLECSAGFLSYELKWGAEPSRRHRDQILAQVLAHREALLTEWKAKVDYVGDME